MDNFDLRKYLAEGRLLREAVKLSDLFHMGKPKPNVTVVPSQFYKDENAIKSFEMKPKEIKRSKEDGDYAFFDGIGDEKKGESRYSIEGDEVVDIITVEDAMKKL